MSDKLKLQNLNINTPTNAVQIEAKGVSVSPGVKS